MGAASMRDHTTLLRATALVAGALLLSVVTLTTSRAAFSDVTDNTGNSFAAGSVELVDDDSSTALFTVTGMAPGDSVVECITVTYQGSITDPGPVMLYSGGYTGSQPLAAALQLTVAEGTGGEFGDCDGFVGSTLVEGETIDSLATAHASYATGVEGWTPSATPQSRTYRFTVQLAGDAADALQGTQVTAAAFVWEVRS